MGAELLSTGYVGCEMARLWSGVERSCKVTLLRITGSEVTEWRDNT
ncbi:hypothetical protein [Paenibacillus sp. NPDC058367]